VDRDVQARIRKGVGLANIRARLEQLYGGEHRFALENHPQGGVVVRISLPFRRADHGAGKEGAAR
jgi:sensor histidine kinase YesM